MATEEVKDEATVPSELDIAMASEPHDDSDVQEPFDRPVDENGQSAPLVGHGELAPASETIPVEELNVLKKKDGISALDKLGRMEEYLANELLEVEKLVGEEAHVVRSLFDNLLGTIKRAKYNL